MDINYYDNALTATQLAFCRNEAGWGHTPIEQANKALQNTVYSVSAMQNNNIIGIGRLVGDGALVWYIQDLIVLPNNQNKGIGTSLIEKLLEYAYYNSIEDSFLTIGLMSAIGKESFYQNFGFRTRPNENEGAGMVIKKKIYSNL